MTRQTALITGASSGVVIDVLVNDAGVGQGGPFHESPLEKDIYLIRLNIEAVTLLCPGPTDTDFFRRADMLDAAWRSRTC